MSILHPQMRNIGYILLLAFLVACSSCNDSAAWQEEEQLTIARLDSIAKADSIARDAYELNLQRHSASFSTFYYEEAKGNYEYALDISHHLLEMTDSLAQYKISELENKRANELLRHQNRELELRLQRQQSIYVACIAILSLLLLSFIGYRYFRRMSISISRKEDEIMRLNKRIASDESEKEQLMAENKALQQEIAQYTSTQAEKGLAIIHRLREAPYSVEKEEMKSILAVTNQVHQDVLLRLAAKYPLLTRIDLQYCCLVFLGFTNAQICTILYVTESAISKWLDRMSVKTSHKRETIYHFLHDFLFSPK